MLRLCTATTYLHTEDSFLGTLSGLAILHVRGRASYNNRNNPSYITDYSEGTGEEQARTLMTGDQVLVPSLARRISIQQFCYLHCVLFIPT